MKQRPFVRRRAILVAAGVALFVAVLGGLSTDLGPWYAALHVPPWKPPDFLFGPAWTLIFALTALSAAHAWQCAPSRAYHDGILVFYSLNACLNVLWSLLFFRLHRPDWAGIEVVFLWSSIIVLMAFTGRFAVRAAVLLAPYLVWVTFAAALNVAIVRLNGPFGA